MCNLIKTELGSECSTYRVAVHAPLPLCCNVILVVVDDDVEQRMLIILCSCRFIVYFGRLYVSPGSG